MKWLKDLQEDLRKANESKRHDEQQRMKRRSDFMERESKKRLIKRAAKEEALREAEDEENAPPTHSCATNSSSLAADESSSMKPAWCQSKEAADTAQEMAEINEEADLLDFVHDLDFDQYNQDLELQVLLGQVKDRIKKLQREKKKDETTLQTCVDVSNCLSDSNSVLYLLFFQCFLHLFLVRLLQSENAAARAEQLDNHQVVVDFVPSNIDTNEEVHDDDVKSIAETVMTESTIRSIHSRKSLTTLVNKARERMSTIEEGIPQPIIINNDGQRKKIDVNKLPFMNRNPAI
jgi:PAS domain-containing protein